MSVEEIGQEIVEKVKDILRDLGFLAPEAPVLVPIPVRATRSRRR